MEQRRRNGSSGPRQEMAQDQNQNRPCMGQHSYEMSRIFENPELHNDEGATVSHLHSKRRCMHDFPTPIVQTIGRTNMRRSPSLDIEETIIGMKKRLARDNMRQVEMHRDVERKTGIEREETDDSDSGSQEEIDTSIDTGSEWEESEDESEWLGSSPSITDPAGAQPRFEKNLKGVDERFSRVVVALHREDLRPLACES